MNKNLKEFLFGLPLLVCSVLLILYIRKDSQESKKAQQNFMSLAAENILDYEVFSFSSLSETDGEKPESKENIVLLFEKKNEWKTVSLTGIPLNEINTVEDLEKIDVVVFAIWESYSKTYRQYTNGVDNGIVELVTEKVDLYYYNPKTESFFKKKTLPYRELPDKITNRNSEQRTYDMGNVRKQIRKDLGVRFRMAKFTKIFIAFIGLSVLYLIILVILSKPKKQKFW